MTIVSLWLGLFLALPTNSAQAITCPKFLKNEQLIAKAQDIAQKVVDLVYAVVPRKAPHPSKLKRAKIVAHRGAHNNRAGILENTRPAFDLCLQNRI